MSEEGEGIFADFKEPGEGSDDEASQEQKASYENFIRSLFKQLQPHQKCSEIIDLIIKLYPGYDISPTTLDDIVQRWATRQAEWEDGEAGDNWKSTRDAAVQRDEIQDQFCNFPEVTYNYRVLERVGQGTFSLVYKAVDIHHHKWENSWCKCGSESNSVGGAIVCGLVAIKLLHRSASTERIYGEINTLHRVKQNPNVAPLLRVHRCEGQIALILPYYETDRIETALEKRELTIDEVRCYLRSMFGGLKSVHEQGIIHRDVKPQNFLWNRTTRTGAIVDFGLAEQLQHPSVFAKQGGSSKAKQKSIWGNNEDFSEDSPFKDTQKAGLGYYLNDSRRYIKASRNGTRGFRAPEVLLKVIDQTTAIDIWSVGITLLAFLALRYPFFVSHNDEHSLLELAHIFGLKAMKEAAANLGRTFHTNIPTIKNRISFIDIIKDCGGMDDIPETALDLLSRCLDLDPRTRITAEEALNHPFLKEDMEE
ncbi:kinase-like domain-containing protein [Chytridium lagenaria]|nr:kinase-like domain-containing protein [Chytridium lagenaria]